MVKTSMKEVCGATISTAASSRAACSPRISTRKPRRRKATYPADVHIAFWNTFLHPVWGCRSRVWENFGNCYRIIMGANQYLSTWCWRQPTSGSEKRRPILEEKYIMLAISNIITILKGTRIGDIIKYNIFSFHDKDKLWVNKSLAVCGSFPILVFFVYISETNNQLQFRELGSN